MMKASKMEVTAQLNKERLEMLKYNAIVDCLLAGSAQVKHVDQAHELTTQYTTCRRDSLTPQQSMVLPLEARGCLPEYAGAASRWSTSEGAASGDMPLPERFPAHRSHRCNEHRQMNHSNQPFSPLTHARCNEHR